MDNLPNCALYNTKQFTYYIELAYHKMYARYQDELTPINIDVLKSIC